MSDAGRPDPDRLLQAISREAKSQATGKLRIFFGMSAGVGKTYAMLEAAQQRRGEGIDVVVGIVETHGRVETEALLTGLKIIPRRELAYRGIAVQEMDLDAVLARNPRLVLVDELAHTNVPGSRHPKRWQDVVELLDAGIDVYTTLNVQHLESRKEYVEEITGITIRETVPDTILQRATQIVLVDITPSELLQRLKEGKVYLGDKAEMAAQNFFTADRLTALREIALRITAEAVDQELQGLTASHSAAGPWKITERLMVAVSHSPHSEDLIRSTRRLAFSLGASWIAVNVDNGAALGPDDAQQLDRNLSLVRELGGEVVNITDVDIGEALAQVARQRGITQLVIGHPGQRRLRDLLGGGTLLDRLSERATTFDIHVLKPERAKRLLRRPLGDLRTESSAAHYLLAVGAIVVASLLSAALLPVIGYHAVGFVFLLGVLLISLFVSLGPMLLAALLSAVVWNFYFIPPVGTFDIGEPADIAMCVALLVAASVTGTLTGRIRRRERLLRAREQRTTALYQLASDLSAALDQAALEKAISANLSTLLKVEIGIALKSSAGELTPHNSASADHWMSAAKEWAVARWAFEHRKPAGWSTDTLASAGGMYIPLIGPSESVGVLGLKRREDGRLSHDEMNLLLTAARQLAVAAERELFQERSRRLQQLQDSERLYQTILNTVSHELRTPLTAIIGNASALDNEQIANDATRRKQLSAEIITNAERLNRVVSNLLDMSRLNSGKMVLKRDWHDLTDLVSVTLDSQRSALAGHVVAVRLADGLPLVRVDFHLLQQALANLLVNAATYAPPQTVIEIGARVADQTIVLSVTDQGPGLPPEAIPQLFEMFFRGPGSRPGGAGIGLAITRGIVELHGGTVTAENLTPGGARFAIRLPVDAQPQLPQDRSEV